MAFCSRCGDHVRWARTETGKWHPPLSLLGSALAVDDANVVRVVAAYEPHVCDPQRVEAFADEQAQAFALRKETEDACAQAWRAAIERDCPRCGRKAGERCRNLRDASRDTVWPHEARRS